MLNFVTCVFFKNFRRNEAILKMSLKKENNLFGKTSPLFGCPGAPNHTSKPKGKTISNGKFQVLHPPVISESDKKEYKVIKLENGFTACLIADKAPIEVTNGPSGTSSASESEYDSDGDVSSESGGSTEFMDEDIAKEAVEEKMAAAGLCVGVGSFSDPKEVPGMAHFLEHMVFMGSEKFPTENDFDSFIKKGGGTDNASTDAETTCFYFECLEKHLSQALYKFAQFFISPLMKKGAMTREREAIESEFQIALPSDSSRKEQLFCTFAHPESPVNTFTWGNLITLRDNVSDDELYKGVHEFRKRHYSAHRMTLAIQARLPMETIEKYVVHCFSDVPNNGLDPDNFKGFAEGIFDTPEFHRLYYVKPIKDICQVDLTWSFPCLFDKYKSKPHEYISHLLGDEGKGSLLSYLRKKVWGLATSIGSGDSGTDQNSMYTLFSVTILLTDEGFEHLYEVIEVVYSFINLLKEIGPQERIFNEIKTISDTSFKFSTEETAVEFVEDLCQSMQVYPSVDYISGSEIYYEFDPEGIELLTNLLQPDKMNIMVMSKTLPKGVKYDKVEKWFGTEYTDREIPEEWINRWQTVKPFPELNIPPPNPYLTTDFSILPLQEDQLDYPQKISTSALHEIWYRKDQKFLLPIAYYYFYLISPKAVESASSPVMLDMMMNLLLFVVTEEVYPAARADLSYSFQSHEKGLLVKVSGYNEKLPLLIEVLTKYLVNLNDHITEDMFKAVKNKVVKSYYNKFLKPSNLAKDIRLNLLVNNHWTSVDKYSALLAITFDELKQFTRDFFQSLYVKSLVQGNVSLDVASETVNNFVKSLQCDQLPENSYPKFRVAKVPIGAKCCRVETLGKNDTNSIITNYYQCGPFSIRTSVIIETILLIIEEPLFDILRTKEQLGYHVVCSIRDTFGILGYIITVNAQATKHTTSYVDSRIENFLKGTNELLADITEEQLKETKEDLIKTKQCTDVRLKEEVDRNWSEIVSDDYLFDRLKQEVNVIQDININEIRDWWSKHNLFGSQENFRKLSIQVVGNKNITKTEPMEIESLDEKNQELVPPDKYKIKFLGLEGSCKSENRSEDYFVCDIEKFKRSIYLYPTLHEN